MVEELSQSMYSNREGFKAVELLDKYAEMQRVVDETLEKYMPRFIKLLLEKVDDPVKIEAWMEELKRCRNEEISLEIRYVIAKAIQRKTMELEKT